MTNTPRFSDLTVIEAAELFTYLNHAGIHNLILRFNLEDHMAQWMTTSRQHKVNMIIGFAKKNPKHQTAAKNSLPDEIVEEAAKLVVRTKSAFWSDSPHHEPFLRALARDGFELTEEGTIQKTLPDTADLPQAQNELHALLDELNLTTVKGHLEQAIANHSDGEWASANSQLRSCLEGLFDEIAVLVASDKVGNVPTGHNRRQFLANTDPPFFKSQLNEWSPDGKNFVEGLFKRLHPEGSHPGLSDEEDSTLRLHMVIIVARYFLRRAKSFASES